ncbi:MarR family 2-MHQ and catechol resistance regulon transcriptional repressor [Paenibacillus endophyticus]|uniref:MarR family 2-MHQ and catechol resistance regulon transcriptional repressor n=1 Tax=Paenibacillus endophyticus TaxID=1294268 RepID=A0A7W5CCZ7_9BACL|nr:MarR family transcriptional regulator [Paenibacillus endophyticus]MBB3155443.1 MarR family 2-MHQ and catechol resistance regulon transcriptional repressor [Paenibacillus endophyticus]
MTDRDAEGKALDLKLSRVMRKIIKTLFGSLERNIDSYNLDRETFQILELLYNKGPHSIKKISEANSIPSGSITYVVDKLEKKRFVERLAAPDDRRKTNVALSGEGRNYFDTIFPKHAHFISDSLSFATDEEKLELIHVLKKIGHGIKNRENNDKNEGSDFFEIWY